MISFWWLLPAALLSFIGGGWLVLALTPPIKSATAHLTFNGCVHADGPSAAGLVKFCTAFPDARCGSGYCVEHCADDCGKKGCLDPYVCAYCDKPHIEHAPPKCLFSPTVFKPRWKLRAKAKK